MLNLNTTVLLAMGDEDIITTWGDFLDDNREYMSGEMVEQLEADLLARPGCTAFVGGGAHGDISLRIVVA